MPENLKSPPPLVWWIIWAAISTGFLIIYFIVPNVQAPDGLSGLRYVPALLFAASALVRWTVLPRFRRRVEAFPVFVIGLALAEGCGLLGHFLIPDLRETYFVLSLLGLVQFAPVFVGRYPT